MDQRLIVRIQLLIPIYALSCWLGLTSDVGGAILKPIREIYEAFVIYTFFTLLTNLLGGERDIIISASGREPKPHLYPFNHLFDKVDISDPYTFLAIKRGILQYTWIKPFLCLARVVLDMTEQGYDERSVSLTSGYLWVAIVYNVSVSLSLYCLALFWYCLHDDLKPYRPLSKFLCIKVIIFFSYWQGLVMSVLVYLGLIPGSPENNVAEVTQNVLMSFEMVGFAIGHWYAFSYHDYAAVSMIGFARLPVFYAMRDAFGIVDLIIDFNSTFWGSSYGYRQFDSIESVLAHPESRSRQARIMEGMRYKNGGRSKYWLPQSTLAKRGLLGRRHRNYGSTGVDDGEPNAYHDASSSSEDLAEGTSNIPAELTLSEIGMTEQEFSQDDALYAQARRLKYGDYNFPVITVRESVPYTTVIDYQKSRGVPTSLEQEYNEFDANASFDDFA